MNAPSTRTALPDFVIIGAMKSATTTLYRQLGAHPDIGMSALKETDYFAKDTHSERMAQWYRSQFDLSAAVVGEASPNYTKRDLFPGVPERLAAHAPKARLIFAARDPVARFVSHYHHSWQLGHMNVLPEKLLDSDPGRIMLNTSRYAWQLEPWIKLFGRDRLLIVDFDMVRDDPQSVFDQMCDHIGVSRRKVANIEVQNAKDSLARMPKSLQKLRRMRAFRGIDSLMSREMRDRARRFLSRGQARKAPELPPHVLNAVAGALAEDAAAFRALSGVPFTNWRV